MFHEIIGATNVALVEPVATALCLWYDGILQKKILKTLTFLENYFHFFSIIAIQVGSTLDFLYIRGKRLAHNIYFCRYLNDFRPQTFDSNSNLVIR